jgi:hypothetical protein
MSGRRRFSKRELRWIGFSEDDVNPRRRRWNHGQTAKLQRSQRIEDNVFHLARRLLRR